MLTLFGFEGILFTRNYWLKHTDSDGNIVDPRLFLENCTEEEKKYFLSEEILRREL